uniref:Uncharacterized protein n=1 Tax=Timema douglasi TaxID=61478 RepID=A0A7R8VY02_TIMDO|nr:unnamed protein product [Timema douglasi]
MKPRSGNWAVAIDLFKEAINSLSSGSNEEEARELKRKKKRTNKERKKLQDRLNLKMVLRGDEGPRLEGEDMFALNQVTTVEALNTVIDQVPDTVAESDPDSDDELEPKRKMVAFKRDRSDHLDSSGTFYKSDESDIESDNTEESDSGEEGLVAIVISHSSPLGSNKVKPSSEDWAVTINFLITSLSSGSNVKV